MNREINTSGETGKRTGKDAAAINFFPSTQSHPSHKIRFDDLIVSLTDAHENRRARQVTEWERLRAHHNLSLL